MNTRAVGRRPSLSVAIITRDEETNIRRTLESVRFADEIVIVDSGSIDRTCEIAREFGAKVFVEPWKGFAAQKNSALDKCAGDWILSLDADEEVSKELAAQLGPLLTALHDPSARSFKQGQIDVPFWGPEPFERPIGFLLPRRNFFLGRWIRFGGFYPDRKMRLIRKGCGSFESRRVHEDIRLNQHAWFHGWNLKSADIIHHAYPTLSSYIEHMNRYSSLAAEMLTEKRGDVGFSFVNIVVRPSATFFYNYFLRLGFLDGKEGFLLHFYHAVYVSWKYAKEWEMSRRPAAIDHRP